jgi:hypothetical protein
LVEGANAVQVAGMAELGHLDLLSICLCRCTIGVMSPWMPTATRWRLTTSGAVTDVPEGYIGRLGSFWATEGADGVDSLTLGYCSRSNEDEGLATVLRAARPRELEVDGAATEMVLSLSGARALMAAERLRRVVMTHLVKGRMSDEVKGVYATAGDNGRAALEVMCVDTLPPWNAGIIL